MNLETEHFVKVLRDVAQQEPNRVVREVIKAHANNVDYLIMEFTEQPSLENLRHLIGSYTKAYNALQKATPVVPPSTPQGTLFDQQVA